MVVYGSAVLLPRLQHELLLRGMTLKGKERSEGGEGAFGVVHELRQHHLQRIGGVPRPKSDAHETNSAGVGETAHVRDDGRRGEGRQ